MWSMKGPRSSRRLLCLSGQNIQTHCFYSDFGLAPCPSDPLILDLLMTNAQGHLKTHGEAMTNGLENHDRDTKFCAVFKQILGNSGVNRVPLPPRSPRLNSVTERWVKSVKDETLSRVILFGESSLRHVLSEYLVHDHTERCHQGLGNVIPFRSGPPANDREGLIEYRERLSGLLKYDHRKAA